MPVDFVATRVTANSEVRSGQPIIRGTRITVWDILGWLGAGRALHLSLPIRTAVVKRGELMLSVGGGIVADSTPEAEWAETHVKARAFAAALS